MEEQIGFNKQRREGRAYQADNHGTLRDTADVFKTNMEGGGSLESIEALAQRTRYAHEELGFIW